MMTIEGGASNYISLDLIRGVIHKAITDARANGSAVSELRTLEEVIEYLPTPTITDLAKAIKFDCGVNRIKSRGSCEGCELYNGYSCKIGGSCSEENEDYIPPLWKL